MKICFVSESPLPWGGTSAREIEFMQALVQGGHEVHAIFKHISEEGKELRKLEGVKIHNDRSKLFMKADKNLEILSGTLNIQYYFKKINELKDEMDVFHFSNHSRAFLGAFYKELFDFSSVASLHNSANYDQMENIYGKLKGWKKSPLNFSKDIKENRLTPHHESILFTTEKGKNFFLKKYSNKLKGDCYTIPNPIDPKDVKTFKKKSLPISERKKVIGRFTQPRGGVEEKNQELEEIIIPKVTSVFPDTKFLLIGKEPPRNKKIDNNHVEYTGYVNDLNDAFKKLKLGIVTGGDTVGGGFRSRGTEYIKRGIPFIGYPPRAIRPSWGFAEDNGAIILKNSPEQVANEIIDKLENPENITAMSKASFESAKELYYGKIASQLEECYKSTIEKHKEKS